MNTVTAYKNNKYKVSDTGLVINKKTKHIITPVDKYGYFKVRISYDNKTKCVSLHKLIYESFNGKLKKRLQINHINGIRHDNRLSNLEAVTPQQNINKMIHKNKGEMVNTAKLSEKDVINIRKSKRDGTRTIDLVNKYNVNKSTILRIIRGETWKHLPIYEIDNSVWGNPKITGAMSKKTLEKRYGKKYFSLIAKGKKFKKHCPTCTCSQS